MCMFVFSVFSLLWRPGKGGGGEGQGGGRGGGEGGSRRIVAAGISISSMEAKRRVPRVPFIYKHV